MLSMKPLSARPLSVALEARVMGVASETGRFGISGQPAALRKFWRMGAEASAFVLAGLDVAMPVAFSPRAFNRVTLYGSTATLWVPRDMRNNFNMVAGDTKTLVITVLDAQGSPVNISGCTIAWRAAKSFRKTAVISKATGGAGVAITDGPNGVFTVALDPTDTEGLVGDLLHEAQVTGTDGVISTVLQGSMKVNRALIRAS